MIEENRVVNLVNDYLKGTDKFLVEVIIRPSNLITVYIDGDHQVSLEDCLLLNRHLEQVLNRDEEDFELTVSSAGLDRPLKKLRQIEKRIGSEVDVVFVTGEKTCGTLVKVDKEEIEIELEIRITKKEMEKKKISFPFREIKTIKEVISFKKIK
jgi:ribosome maturation factor RimP